MLVLLVKDQTFKLPGFVREDQMLRTDMFCSVAFLEERVHSFENLVEDDERILLLNGFPLDVTLKTGGVGLGD